MSSNSASRQSRMTSVGRLIENYGDLSKGRGRIGGFFAPCPDSRTSIKYSLMEYCFQLENVCFKGKKDIDYLFYVLEH